MSGSADGADDHGADYWCSSPIRQCVVPEAQDINPAIVAAYQSMATDDWSRRTHFIGGRFENLYLERERIPQLAPVLERVLGCAAVFLGRPADSLRCGFWLNAMEPGQATSEHTHEENDELLSAVYYVDADEESGDLVLYDGPLTIRCTPESGTLLFFPPDLPHAVEPNQSGRLRLSIGINIGPV